MADRLEAELFPSEAEKLSVSGVKQVEAGSPPGSVTAGVTLFSVSSIHTDHPWAII